MFGWSAGIFTRIGLRTYISGMNAANGVRVLVDLPLPHKLLHPNGHTRKPLYRAALIKKARGDAKLAGIAARYDANQRHPWERATLAATFYVKHHQDMDEDGLIAWLKAYRDGLADAGIVVNDKGFTNAPPVLVKGAKHPRVEIEITEIVTPSPVVCVSKLKSRKGHP